MCVAAATRLLLLRFMAKGRFSRAKNLFWLRHSVIPVGALGLLLLVLFTCGTQVKELVLVLVVGGGSLSQ